MLLETWELLGQSRLPRDFARQVLTLPKENRWTIGLAALPALGLESGGGGRVGGAACAQRVAAAGRRETAEACPSPPRSPSQNGKAVVREELLEDDRLPGLRALRQQRQRRLHPRPARRSARWRIIIATWMRWAIFFWPLRRAVDTGHGRPGPSRRIALPLADRFPFSLVGRLGEKPARRPTNAICSSSFPAANRRQAIIMADHYDTAYMEDVFGYAHGGDGPRLAAAGADDNHSATAALMLAAPIFLELSRQGKLARDIWLLHLTGEEFPADCMGARHVCECLVEGTLRMRLPTGDGATCGGRESKASTCWT